MFFAILVAIVTLTSAKWPNDPSRSSPAISRNVALLLGLIVTQLIVGIWIRHQGFAARPLAANPIFFIHAIIAFSIVAAALFARRSVARDAREDDRNRLEPRCVVLLSLLVLQLLVGLATFGVTEIMVDQRQATFFESWVPTLHVATGAAILASAVSLSLHTFAGSILAYDAGAWATRPADRSSLEGSA